MTEEQVEKSEFTIEIKINNKNLSYRSDFDELTTIGWLESIKSIILKKTFESVVQES